MLTTLVQFIFMSSIKQLFLNLIVAFGSRTSEFHHKVWSEKMNDLAVRQSMFYDTFCCFDRACKWTLHCVTHSHYKNICNAPNDASKDQPRIVSAYFYISLI